MTSHHKTFLLEHGIVADPAGTEYQHFNVPSSLVLLSCEKLMVVFNAHRNHQKCVLGAYSADQGKSWSVPKVLFSNDVPSQNKRELIMPGFTTGIRGGAHRSFRQRRQQ